MKRDNLPVQGEARLRWQERGEVNCGECHEWVPQSQAQWQHRCASAWVFVCTRCVSAYYNRTKREAPDAVSVEAIRVPSRIQQLWDFMEDDND